MNTPAAPTVPSPSRRAEPPAALGVPLHLQEFVTVKLDFPINVSGVKTEMIRLRRPKFRDRKNLASMGLKTEMDWEQNMIALLSDLTPADIEQLDDTDYRRIALAVDSFTPPDLKK